MFEQCKKVKELMSGYDSPWAIAGGWAVDLHLNRETREHGDREIAILRHEQADIKEHLDSFRFQKVANGKLIDWQGEELRLPVHELHASNGKEEIEILLNEVEDGYWIFRRESRIQFEVERLIQYSLDGIPYLHPAIVLLYKAKYMRDKDHQDFLVVKDSLNDRDKTWLLNSLEIHQPDHPWVRILGGSRP